MPELRLNEATKDWVVFAPERARRPQEFRREAPEVTADRPSHRHDCPFCPGNEAAELEVEKLRLPASGDWKVRVLPNKFPALAPGSPSRRSYEVMFRSTEGCGHHEVVVDSPLHNTTFGLMPREDIELVLQAWRERYRALIALPETAQVIIFRNHGALAGTSLEHPHSQLISLPVVPGQVRHRLEDAMRFYNEFGCCVYCKMLSSEREAAERVVVAGSCFTAFIPFAAFSPFHCWIVPHRHGPCFSETTAAELADLAGVLKDLLCRYYHGLNDPDYNLVLRSASHDYVGGAFFHWYLALVPRLSKMAGFEMGSGMFINPTLPKEDAAFLREVKI